MAPHVLRKGSEMADPRLGHLEGMLPPAYGSMLCNGQLRPRRSKAPATTHETVVRTESNTSALMSKGSAPLRFEPTKFGKSAMKNLEDRGG